MKIDDLNNFLEELTHEDITTERQLEIFGSIRTGFEDLYNEHQDLVTNTEKLQNDYESLRKKRVDEFFGRGTEVDKKKIDESEGNDNTPEGQVTIDDILDV